MLLSHVPIYFVLAAIWGACCVGAGYFILHRVKKDFPKFLAGCLITFGWVFIGIPVAVTFVALSMVIGFKFCQAVNVLGNMPMI